MRCNQRILCGLAALLTAGSAGFLQVSGGGTVSAGQVMPDFSYLGAFGSLSAAETEQTARAVYQGLAAHSDAIDLGTVQVTQENLSDIAALYREVASVTDAGLLSSTQISLAYSAGRMMLRPGYLAEGAAYAEMYQDCEKQIEAILSGVDPAWSEAEKALYLHDYLAIHYNYDYPALYGEAERPYREQYTAYGLLRNGAAVCQGYSELYALLLNRIGIAARMVASKELNHAWNYVRIDGQWYFTDVTWDDSFQYYAGEMTHTSFLRTTAEMEQTKHTSTDWLLPDGTNVYGAVTSERFSNAFWVTCGAVVPWQGKWAAFDSSSNTVSVYDYNAAANSVRTETVDAPAASLLKWPVIGKPGYYWQNAFVIPAAANGVLYYSLPDQILAVRSGTPQTVLELTDAELQKGRIYGLYVQDGYLYYGIDSGPNYADYLTQTIEYNAVPLSTLEQRLGGSDPVTPPQPKGGDPDGDGAVTNKDAQTVLVAYTGSLGTGKVDLPEDALKAADVNGDGKVGVDDAQYILIYYTENTVAGNPTTWEDVIQ